MKNVRQNLSPLCFLPCGNLVCYNLGKLVIIEDGLIIDVYPLFHSLKERFVGRFNALYRLFRLGVRVAEPIDNDNILISIGNMLFEYCFSTRTLSKGFFIEKGIRPLIFTTISEIEGFDNCIIFGGYLGNSNKKPVNIYKRIATDRWKIVYTFGQGTINHVHNIVADSYRQCLWAFTGDFGRAAAIWKIEDNFRKVECLLCDDQKYRSCVAFPIKDGLLYVTDAPFAQNYVYLMRDDLSVIKYYKIDGSCIYGCQCGVKYIFSSTVEPDGRNNSLINLLISRKRGKGIQDMYVHMYMGNLEEGFKEVYKEKKDLWPYLFQFGTIRFPYGKNSSDVLYFQPIGTKKNDLKLIIQNLSEW